MRASGGAASQQTVPANSESIPTSSYVYLALLAGQHVPSTHTPQCMRLVLSIEALDVMLLRNRAPELREGDFHHAAEATLESLQELLEQFVDELDIAGGDVEYGVRLAWRVPSH
jgi:hypothetical protein